jgi:hypothetical protein
MNGDLMWIRYFKASIIGFSLATSLTANAEVYPTQPLASVTPGILCSEPDSFRYAENIPYCERDVNSKIKKTVIKLYMEVVPGFTITIETRHEYKIDHYIPLCMGGANVVENLWPQHMTVFKVTDDIEFSLCQQMDLGELSQADAVAQIKFAKSHIEDLKFFTNLTDRLQYIKDGYNK